MSSDKLSSVHEPLMSLDLDIGNKESSSKVSVEMDKSDLQKLITSLEAANKASLFYIAMPTIFNNYMTLNYNLENCLDKHACTRE